MARYSIADLANASGFPERSIRHYVGLGFLPRAEYRGKDTLYDEAHRVGLAAIAKLREDHKVYRIEALRSWFRGKSPAEIESFVTGAPFPAPPVASAPPAPPPAPPPPETEEIAPPPATPHGERWIHLGLVPGMQLLVQDGAPPLVLRLAAEIREKYGTK